MLRKLLNYLLSPFRRYLSFFLFSLLFSSSVQIIAFAMLESFPKGVYIAMHHYVICYFLALLWGLLSGLCKKVYAVILTILLVVNYLIDFFCLYVYDSVFDREISAVILGTNNEEAVEFIGTFFSWWLMILPLLGLFGVWGVYRLLKSMTPRLGVRVSVACLILVAFSLINILCGSRKNFGLVSIGKVYTFLSTTTPPDLRMYYTNPRIDGDSATYPENVVVIVGESLTKSHMSLYGYDKETNPLLWKLKKDSSLFVFSNVMSPAKNTVPTFKSLMSTYRQEYGDDVSWYECTTLLEIMDVAGFRTEWVSNQSSKGWHDNVVAKYAALADTAIFVGNRFSPSKNGDYDGLILDVLPSLLDDAESKFQIIHLMGNHYAFDKRYPAEYECFSPIDYEAYPEHQRYNRATYDNSVLYNDYVVGSIMDSYKDKDAIVFYFSDHSIDIYETSDDYVGHARRDDIAVGKRVPFMVYMTDTYKKNHSFVYNKIIETVDRVFNTEDFIYTIMDVVGMRFKDNNDVERNSLLSFK